MKVQTNLKAGRRAADDAAGHVRRGRGKAPGHR
jgi:hypothetical protein